jgi:hypothetical protein
MRRSISAATSLAQPRVADIHRPVEFRQVTHLSIFLLILVRRRRDGRRPCSVR